MTPSLPYGRGSYSGADNYQNQQESYAIRRELVAKETGWVVRASMNSLWSVGGSSAGHTINTLYLARLPIFYDTFELSEARVRIAAAAANESLKVGIYIYNSEPKRYFRLITPSKVLFPLDATGVITKSLSNKPRIIAGKKYFIGTIITDALAEVFSATASTTSDEATLSVTVSDLLENAPLSSTAKAYPGILPMPSYFSKDAAEIL